MVGLARAGALVRAGLWTRCATGNGGRQVGGSAMRIKLTRQTRRAKQPPWFYGELWEARLAHAASAVNLWHMVAASDRFDVGPDDYSPLTLAEMDGYAKTFDCAEVLA